MRTTDDSARTRWGEEGTEMNWFFWFVPCGSAVAILD